jgi:hypothetical protein
MVAFKNLRTPKESFTRSVTIEDSAQIYMVWYSPAEEQMIIEFINGDQYEYDSVLPSEFGELVGAPSVGSYFNRHLKTVKNTSKLMKEDYLEQRGS